MWREIRAVKTNIKRIVKANRRFKDYVIGTFNDPYRRKVIRSRSAYTILRFLKRVRARRGGDCPEFAMRGILDAARLARPRSVLFVVTDASAKDARLKYAVARYLRSKKIRLFAVKVGRMCGRRYRREFEFLARQTGGRVLRFRRRVNFRYLMRFITKAVYGKVAFNSMPSSGARLRRLRPRCPADYYKLEETVRVCKCSNGTDQTKPPPRVVGSLAFTIDNTGSMWREIRAVKTNIKRIVKANRRFKDYVIGTFNDPYRRKVIRSRSAYTILRFLKRVRARRGGDCPEFAMRGILDAARLARPRSVLFVVTDASAKDARLKYAVARYLRSKKIRLFAVKVGRMCGRRYRREFEFLARQTGGRVLRLRNRRHFKYVSHYVSKIP
uniref:VWFA domain-containing protein n=3 Tax=Macrostomum lignano TaxID=282301 RepID=A0A1I8GUE1_9PLAT